MLLLRYRGGFLKNNIILGLSHLQKPLFDLFFSYFLFQLWFPHKRFVHLLERSYHFIMITFLHQNIVPALHASKRDNVLQPGLLLQISDHIFPRRIFIVYFDIGIARIILRSIFTDAKLSEFFPFPKLLCNPPEALSWKEIGLPPR